MNTSLSMLKSALAVGVKTPQGILPEKASHWDDDIRVLQNKMTIEICKTEEGLNIADISGLRPVFSNLPPMWSVPSFFFTNRTRAPMGDWDGQMVPVVK